MLLTQLRECIVIEPADNLDKQGLRSLLCFLSFYGMPLKILELENCLFGSQNLLKLPWVCPLLPASPVTHGA